jgi:hypothetical protein
VLPTEQAGIEIEPESDHPDPIAELDTEFQQPSPRNALFTCPVETCTSSFVYMGNLIRHLEENKHRKIPEKVTLQDYALKKFIDHIEEISTEFLVPQILEEMGDPNSNFHNKLVMGWGLPVKRSFERFDEEVKIYLAELFERGIRENRKMDPKTAEGNMKKEKNEDGSKRFSKDQLLSWKQIASYFGRLAQKQRKLEESGREKRDTEIESLFNDLEFYEGVFEDELKYEPMFQGEFEEIRALIEENRHEIFE